MIQMGVKHYVFQVKSVLIKILSFT